MYTSRRMCVADAFKTQSTRTCVPSSRLRQGSRLQKHERDDDLASLSARPYPRPFARSAEPFKDTNYELSKLTIHQPHIPLLLPALLLRIETTRPMHTHPQRPKTPADPRRKILQ